MTISLYNRVPLDMTCKVTSSPLAILVVDDEQQEQLHVDHDYKVFDELDNANYPPEPQTTLIIRGGGYDVYVWDYTSSGYDLWALHSSGYRHRTYTSPVDLELWVVTVASGSSPPSPPAGAPPAPGTGQTLLKVKVRKKGDVPI